ncbi:MAG TPA: hypothetical protein VMT29_09470 [Steroidobacteraceae bacterium]|nr:hypothetical protein [Steroidobacteraceae bacterium]
MSSSCPKVSPRRKASPRGARLGAACGAALLALAAASAPAADVFYQPVASVQGQWNTNIELQPGAAQSGAGYMADVATLIGVATPNSQLTLRPDVRYEYYPTDTSLNRLEAMLDINGQLRYQRDKFSLRGRIDRRDDLNAEIQDAQFNPVNPGLPVTPTTGRVSVGVVRDNVYLTPSYDHGFSALFSGGLSATFQRMTYSPNDPSAHVGFNYYQAQPYFDYTVSARSDIQFGVFGAKFEAVNIESHSEAYGGLVQGTYNWSPIFHSTLTVLLQRTRNEQTTPTPFQDSTTNWGANVETVYAGRTDKLRLTVGRQILPSSGGGLYNTDQVQGQYDREITERFALTAALLYQRLGTLASNSPSDTRNYLVGQVFAEWMLTRVLFIRGGYSYQWQKYRFDPEGANNNQVSLQFGYRGLGRQY